MMVKGIRGRPPIAPMDRLMQNMEPCPMTGCWLWTGWVNHKGYGTLDLMGKSVRAHRLSWLLFNGPIPSGILVCHHCDIPCCINPAHLWLGTESQNRIDSFKKGRSVSAFIAWHQKMRESYKYESSK